ncbi:MAG: hypothetical protein WA683_14795, partial [Pseudolabrys sp.]
MKALEHVVCLHWHTAALFFKFFATSQRDCSVSFWATLRLSHIEGGGRNYNSDREKPCWDDRRDGTTAHGWLHHFVLPEERRFFWTLQRGRPTEKTSGWDTFKPSVYI